MFLVTFLKGVTANSKSHFTYLFVGRWKGLQVVLTVKRPMGKIPWLS